MGANAAGEQRTYREDDLEASGVQREHHIGLPARCLHALLLKRSTRDRTTDALANLLHALARRIRDVDRMQTTS